MESEKPADSGNTVDSTRAGKDAIEVKVVDQKTADQLKQRYFNGYMFPK